MCPYYVLRVIVCVLIRKISNTTTATNMHADMVLSVACATQRHNLNIFIHSTVLMNKTLDYRTLTDVRSEGYR